MIVAGGKLYDRCGECGSLVRPNKPVLGSMHVCAPDPLDPVIIDRDGCYLAVKLRPDDTTFHVYDAQGKVIVKSYGSKARAIRKMHRLAKRNQQRRRR